METVLNAALSFWWDMFTSLTVTDFLISQDSRLRNQAGTATISSHLVMLKSQRGHLNNHLWRFRWNGPQQPHFSNYFIWRKEGLLEWIVMRDVSCTIKLWITGQSRLKICFSARFFLNIIYFRRWPLNKRQPSRPFQGFWGHTQFTFRFILMDCW